MSNSELNAPPTFLADAQKSVLKALDPSEALRAALTAASDDPAAYGPVLALHNIQSYLDAAKRQQRRIQRNGASPHKAMRKGRPRRGEGLFADVHFYLICWARIDKSASFIRDATRFKRLGQVLRRYRPQLKERNDARDHLEHFDERLPGGRKHYKLAVSNDLLNMRNEFLTYGGRKLDIGPNSIRLLKEIVAQLQLAVLYDSLEALETTEPRCLSRLLRRAVQEVSVARDTKKVMRMLGDRVKPRSIRP